MWESLFLLLPLAAFSGWLIGRRALRNVTLKKLANIHQLFNNTIQPETLANLIEENADQIETHLALGGLFRRRGEVEKAVGIHQNLINTHTLTEEQRALSLLELSRDYMRAGVLDRAESVLLNLIDQEQELEASFQHLIDIYQQSKDWKSAIKTAEQWQTKTNRNLSFQIAHFYCEIAEQEWLRDERELAVLSLKKALSVNRQCVRANVLLGHIESQLGNYSEAIKAYKQIQKQDPAFLSEILLPIARCYEKLNNPVGMIEYFHECLEKHLPSSAVLVFAEWLQKNLGKEEALNFVIERLKKNPSLRGLKHLVNLSLLRAEGDIRQDLSLFQSLIETMLTNKPFYRCQGCGFSGRTLQWQCPSCKRWDVVKPIHD